MKPLNIEAYNLFHKGTLALAVMEANGIRIDLKYIQEQKQNLTKSIAELEKKLLNFSEIKEWEKIYRNKFNYNSSDQLRYMLFTILKYTSIKSTAKGKEATDKEVLSSFNLPFTNIILEIKKLTKARDTYL